MRKLSAYGLLAAALSAVPAFAQDAAAPVVEAAAPIVDKGDAAWLMMSAVLVIFMTLPGLALFYGGLVRAKNMLSVLMQVLTIFSIIAILWVAFGYSLAFTGAGSAEDATFFTPYIGGLSKAFLAGVGTDALAETFSTGVYVPELAFVIFQMAFACIASALIVGATAERLKFSAVILFVVIWFCFSYIPMAHMVWWWGGPSAYDAPSGLLFGHGALDFAGGTVIHINAGVAALVAAMVAGPRLGYRKELLAPHNLTFTLVGGCILWVGWFGFNAGSNLEANGLTALAMINTAVATAAAVLAWSFGEWMMRGHPSLLGGISGAIAGLVGVTPAAGFVGPMGAIAIGLIAGLVCMWFVISVKPRMGIDDSLDVFGIHGVGGIVGAILTGVFAAPSLGGGGVFDYSTGAVGEYAMGAQVWNQTLGVIIAIVWSAVVSFIAIHIVKALIGLRVSDSDERQGLDVTTHGENAYN
ncbi:MULTISPECIES: ammonium transporter [Paracoccus]|jgi:Amt family ammonium transporter|uniref:Ammonium transporter n=1 Tax=Paracoccus haeundaensis TaxID=225362 RepID=A0A5C4R1L3_9RHOB|nr:MULTISPECIES: ammonium transporter [Paracoccus]TYP66541.1 ammonium transporter [Stutzerimonas stutzeri]KIX18101.1 ammonia channel protein [Paracoccus sp. 228]KJZ30310.1 ammonia channel protein [Paracoccus sp. S4493]MBF5079451.1 ammonium transporter [Paracoccus sp. NBH48]QXI64971.1 Ammonia channel [Paracoccus marcusii]|tara:strand:+ start:145 stop:1551 length:1407 start_codon:yes stop_codon:yes gene_type:complete